MNWLIQAALAFVFLYFMVKAINAVVNRQSITAALAAIILFFGIILCIAGLILPELQIQALIEKLLFG